VASTPNPLNLRRYFVPRRFRREIHDSCAAMAIMAYFDKSVRRSGGPHRYPTLFPAVFA
jgi:hypothetical protein